VYLNLDDHHSIDRLGEDEEGGYRLTVSKHHHEHNQYELLVKWQATSEWICMYSEVNNHDDDGGERVAIWLIRAFIVVIRDTL
jgi:hypothetical protein